MQNNVRIKSNEMQVTTATAATAAAALTAVSIKTYEKKIALEKSLVRKLSGILSGLIDYAKIRSLPALLFRGGGGQV